MYTYLGDSLYLPCDNAAQIGGYGKFTILELSPKHEARENLPVGIPVLVTNIQECNFCYLTEISSHFFLYLWDRM